MESDVKKVGRPTIFSEELALAICTRLWEGESVLQICKDPEMPARATIFRWLNESNSFKDMYREAREGFMDYHHDYMIDIADDGTNDWYERNGYLCVNNEAVNRSKLRVNTRQWIVERGAPRKYGPKPEDEGNSAENLPPIQIEVQIKPDTPIK